MRYTKDIGVLVLVLLLTVVCLFLFKLASNSHECVRLGYRSSIVSLGGKVYCHTRIEGTDVVLPIEEARKKPR